MRESPKWQVHVGARKYRCLVARTVLWSSLLFIQNVNQFRITSRPHDPRLCPKFRQMSGSWVAKYGHNPVPWPQLLCNFDSSNAYKWH